MNIFTHLYIALRVKQSVEREIPVKIDTLSFLYGSIKPDVSSQFSVIPHFKKDAEWFIRKEIQNLFTEYVFENERCEDGFSERLGVLVHYLSDFFCFAHSELFKGSMLEHHRYEMQLFTYFAMNLGSLARYGGKGKTLTGRVDGSEAGNSVSSIMEYIDRLHDNYLDNRVPCSGLKDVAYTFKACRFLCRSVLLACLVSEEGFSDAVKEAFS